MIKKSKPVFFLFIIIFFSSSSIAVNLTEIGKVTNVYQRGKITVVTVEIEVKLPAGVVVYVEKNIPATIGDMYKKKDNKYYYEATLSGRGKINPGAKVYIPGKKEVKGTEVYLTIERIVKFKPKKHGHVLDSYGKQVHIDRGSLHEVRDRDIYAIYDSSGKLKGKIEARAIGDYESISKLYTKKEHKINSGDTVIHLGRRRFFSLGVVYGHSLPIVDKWPRIPYWVTDRVKTTHPLDEIEHIKQWDKFEKGANVDMYGAGLFWEWTFPGGWGIQWLWGVYDYSYERKEYEMGYFVDKNNESGTILVDSEIKYEVQLMFPIVIKKNFFYPYWISPYIGAGLGWYQNKFVHKKELTYYYGCSETSEWGNEILADDQASVSYPSLFPVVGVELFSSNLLHIVIDAKYIFPYVELKGKEESHTWRGWIVSVGVNTNW